MSLITVDDAISGDIIEENRAELHLNLEQNSLSRTQKLSSWMICQTQLTDMMPLLLF